MTSWEGSGVPDSRTHWNDETRQQWPRRLTISIRRVPRCLAGLTAKPGEQGNKSEFGMTQPFHIRNRLVNKKILLRSLFGSSSGPDSGGFSIWLHSRHRLKKYAPPSDMYSVEFLIRHRCHLALGRTMKQYSSHDEF